MQLRSLPSVNSQFKTKRGDMFTVIGRGTRGIVVEYFDGRVELISPQSWGKMNHSSDIHSMH